MFSKISIAKKIHHYFNNQRGPLELENSYLLFPLNSAALANCTNYIKKQNLSKQINQ